MSNNNRKRAYNAGKAANKIVAEKMVETLTKSEDNLDDQDRVETRSSIDGKKKKTDKPLDLSKIAIKRDDISFSSAEVVLLNGRWDMTAKIPYIVAEMHNVNLQEIQPFKPATPCSGTGLGGKQMKIDTIGTNNTSCGSRLSAMPVATATPSPLGSDSGIEGDSDGNLSWLLNYKINELPPVPEQQSQPASQLAIIKSNSNVEYHAIDQHGNLIELPNIPKQVPQINEAPQREEYYAQGNGSKFNPKKPPFTYTELIEHALVEKGELTVSGIYQWISDRFPFYKQNDDRWKNSVRHNLSINPHFRKGSKAVHGAGHLWTIAQKEDFRAWQIKRERMQQFINNTAIDYSTSKLHDIELANATSSIMNIDNDYNGEQKRLQPQNVAVEYVIDVPGGHGDFLCPTVSKEQVAEECGLESGNYLITDLNPAALGINITDADILNGAHLYDDLNFHAYELHGE